MPMDLSRRNFLKGAGIVSAGAALAATLGACSADGATGGGSAEGDSGTDEGGDRTTCIDTRPEPGNSKHPLLPDTPGKDAEPIDPLDAPSQWDDEVDVVVVGSGMGEACENQYIAGSSDNRKRVIMDANFLDVAKANYEASGNDRAYPISQYSKERLNDEAYESMGQYSEDFDGCWQDAIDKGYVKTGNTIEELAEQLGMDPQELKDAVDNYNSLVDAGKDDQLVVPYPIETMAKVTDAPFYGIIVGPHIGKTLCGLRVNMKSQVISVDNEPIPGLYAGYTTAGGFCGENLMNSYWGAPSICAGVAMSGVGGWMCANSILGNYDSIENIWDERVTANKIDTGSDQKASIGGPLGSNSTKGSDDAASGF